MKILLSTLNSKFIHSSLGIYSIAAYLNATSANSDNNIVREYTTQTPILNIMADIQPLSPEIIALAVYIWNKEETLRLTKVIKQVMPNCIIVLGGPEVSFNAAQVLASNSEIDYIIQGEGDIVFSQLVAYLENGGGLPKYVSSQTMTNASIGIVDNLDNLPFVYEQLNLNMDNKIIYYESSRGCPYACSYCLSGVSRNVRYKNYHNVIQDLAYIISKGAKQVKFVDRTYNLDSTHYLPIMHFLAAQDTNTNFHFEIKADLLTDEVLDFLQTVPRGRFQFEIGIQTTHTPTLAAINRIDNWQSIKKSVQKLLGFGNIHIHVDLIAGLPYEDFETFKTSFNNVHNLWADMLQLGFLKILSGSTIEQQIADHEYKYMPISPYEVLSNRYIAYDKLRKLKLIEDLVEKYYNSAKYKHTLRYIALCYEQGMFAFYEQFAEYLEVHNMHLRSFSSKFNMKLLQDFISQSSKLQAHKVELQERLYLDSFIANESWTKEVFISRLDTNTNKELMEEFWRNDELVGKYLPNYKFSAWRQIKKQYSMEEFILNGLKNIYILDVKNAKLIEVDGEDFYDFV